MPELRTVTGENFNNDVTLDTELFAHTSRTDNPHNTTASQLGALTDADKGVPNGIAPLNSSAKIDTSYLPPITGGLEFQGTWDASSGSPPSLVPSNGQYWLVDVAGNTNLDGITDWEIGDSALYDGTSGVWRKIDGSDAVVSVNGYTGIVVLDSTDVGALAITNDLSDLNDPADARTNLGLGNVENVALSTWTGSPNLVTVGTIATGTWEGDPITDPYIASSATWNAAYALALDAVQLSEFPLQEGLIVRTIDQTTGEFGVVEIAVDPTNGLSVLNGDGVDGNPTISLAGATSVTGGALSASFWRLLNNATPYFLGSTLILRDVMGRAKIQPPIAANDIANKAYVDSVVDALDNHNELDELQGGDPDSTIPEFYHLSLQEYQAVHSIENITNDSNNTEVLFNNNGVVDGDPALTFNINTGMTTAQDLTVTGLIYGDVNFDVGTLTQLTASTLEEAVLELETQIENFTTDHNELTNIQGGATSEYYHLTQTQHDTLTDGSNADLLHVHDSSAITFDAETLTGLSATDVESAIIELDNRIDDVEAGLLPHNSLTGLQGGAAGEYFHLTNAEHTNLTTTIIDGSNADILHIHDSSAVTFDGGTLTSLTSDNVEDAIIELETQIANFTTDHNELTNIQGGTATERYHLTEAQHDTLTDGSNADLLHVHDAASVTFDGETLTNLSATNVEDAIIELETNMNPPVSTSSDFPVSPEDGQFHWDDEDEVLYFYRSTVEAWIDISSASLFAVATILYDQALSQDTIGDPVDGDPVYFDGSEWAKANSSSPRPTGIASPIPNAVITNGRVSGLTSLTAGNEYYLASSGGLTTDSSETGIYIGIALSETELIVDIDVPTSAGDLLNGSTGSVEDDTLGSSVIDSTTESNAFWIVTISDGTNIRMSHILAVTDGSSVEYTETSTNDIGDTSSVELSADLSGSDLQLIATSTSGTWTINSKRISI